ncbi:MAG: hypothetical protein Q4C12_07695 [Clostridia bacterium]|nr:hypothetical protein [Clostridia bacterium]
MDRKWFAQCCLSLFNSCCARTGIGTQKERALHKVLKRYFEPDEAFHEQKIGRFVADIAKNGKITEIQTRSFNTLRTKLEAFLPQYEVTLVYPIAHIKHLCWISEDGEVSKRRKSPKKGSIYDAAAELYKIKQFLTNPNLRICLVLIDLTEYRSLNGWSRDKKKGSSRAERIPSDIVDEVYIDDYGIFIPKIIQPFTSREFAQGAHINMKKAVVLLNILNHVGAVERVGKKGNCYLYCKRDA